jgi:DNA-binding GntR family transcriptional regulator
MTATGETETVAGRDPDMAIEPIPDVPALSQRVHNKLEKLVIAGTFPPGSRLVEGDIAQMLGVSRGTVRVALQQLAQDGFVEIRPRQGTFVRVATAKEIDDSYDIRRVLEGESARLAALRITPEGAAKLRACIDDAQRLLAKDEDPVASVENMHRIISSIADNQELTQYLHLHNKRSMWYKAPFEPHRRRQSWDEHAAIVDAIIRGDAAGAAAAMHAHIDGARERYKRLTSQQQNAARP